MKLLFGLVASVCLLAAQAPPRAEVLFDQSCARCHEAGSGKGPDRSALRKLSAEQVYQSIASGSMAKQAESLNDAAKRAIAEYIGSRKLGPFPELTGKCASNP